MAIEMHLKCNKNTDSNCDFRKWNYPLMKKCDYCKEKKRIEKIFLFGGKFNSPYMCVYFA